MADVLLYHHIQGLTDGVRAFADELRAAGHTVHAPDLFEGRTFASIEEGFGYARDRGFEAIGESGAAVAAELGPDLVYAGFSFGVTIAQRLAQTRPGARGALLMYSCLPVSEFGQAWPDGLPVQVHGKEGDEFFDEDLPAARALVESADAAELFLYPGDQHLFADSSLDAFDPQASSLLMERVLRFLAAGPGSATDRG
ncbi:MAG TPA: dienelactone hydrolase family protein [Nocardioides sp.]|nr:dienelactone hydrolase family protein [Nocardioides sp.]